MYILIKNLDLINNNNDKEIVINKKIILLSEIKLENNDIWKIKN